MSIILNLGISNSFQTPQWDRIRFPGTLRIDYVRVYQKGDPQVGCDPASHRESAAIALSLSADWGSQQLRATTSIATSRRT